MSRAVVLLLALLVVAGAGLASPSRALELEPEIASALSSLLEPIVACVDEPDTDRPAFHGCFDWHSAVHANLALRIGSRLRGDRSLLLLADQVASTAAIAGEHRLVADGALVEELPYGFAWLLLLDVEAGRNDVHAMAVDAAKQVRVWLDANLSSEERALGRRYGGSSFPAFALQRWYRRFDPVRAASFAASSAPLLAGHADAACAAAPTTSGFFDPCAALLLALSEVAVVSPAVPPDLLGQMAATVAKRRAVQSDALAAIFGAGLNFSRAWALYAAARALGDERLMARGDELFDAQLAQPEMWRESYEDYSHWVAQFGVFALALRTEATHPQPGPAPGPTPTRSPPIEPPPGRGRPEPQPISASGARRVAPSAWAY